MSIDLLGRLATHCRHRPSGFAALRSFPPSWAGGTGGTERLNCYNQRLRRGSHLAISDVVPGLSATLRNAKLEERLAESWPGTMRHLAKSRHTRSG